MSNLAIDDLLDLAEEQGCTVVKNSEGWQVRAPARPDGTLPKPIHIKRAPDASGVVNSIRAELRRVGIKTERERPLKIVPVTTGTGNTRTEKDARQETPDMFGQIQHHLNAINDHAAALAGLFDEVKAKGEKATEREQELAGIADRLKALGLLK